MFTGLHSLHSLLLFSASSFRTPLSSFLISSLFLCLFPSLALLSIPFVFFSSDEDELSYLTAASLAVPERLSERETGQCRRELDFCLRILHVFSSSILLIDEIDLILHPLRSELHWPVGRKQPLDYTTVAGLPSRSSSSSAPPSLPLPSSSYSPPQHLLPHDAASAAPTPTLFCTSQILEGLTTEEEEEREGSERWRRRGRSVCPSLPLSSSSDVTRQPLSFLLLEQGTDGRAHRGGGGGGLRWQIPWILLDALFFCYEGRMTVPLTDSREAYTILYTIRDVLSTGLSQRALLNSPHLVLLNPRWYDQKLKNLLARWLFLVLFRIRRFTGLTPQQTLLYMVRGTRTTAG